MPQATMLYRPTLNTFEWFEFEPLDPETFYRHFHHAGAVVDRWYQWWTEDFHWSSCRFYRAQYERHLTLEFRRFSCSRGLKVNYLEELGDDVQGEDVVEAWREWLDADDNLFQHRQARDSLLERYNKPKQPIAEMLIGHSTLAYFEKMAAGWGAEQKRQAKALWFNGTIAAVDPQTLRDRLALPYDEYLKSSHWRRVRSALMLVEMAHCAGCGSRSFYGDDREKTLHVHHEHYRNRGHERYEDLALLCEQHHQHEHHTMS